MATLLQPEEIIAIKRAGSVSRNEAKLDSKEADVAMNEGLVIVPGADDYSCKLPTVTGDIPKALGMSVYRFVKEEGASTHYDAAEQVTILRGGTGYVTCTTACAYGGEVYVIHSGGTAGQVRGTADASATLMPNARFAETVAGAGIVQVTFNLPG